MKTRLFILTIVPIIFYLSCQDDPVPGNPQKPQQDQNFPVGNTDTTLKIKQILPSMGEITLKRTVMTPLSPSWEPAEGFILIDLEKEAKFLIIPGPHIGNFNLEVITWSDKTPTITAIPFPVPDEDIPRLPLSHLGKSTGGTTPGIIYNPITQHNLFFFAGGYKTFTHHETVFDRLFVLDLEDKSWVTRKLATHRQGIDVVKLNDQLLFIGGQLLGESEKTITFSEDSPYQHLEGGNNQNTPNISVSWPNNNHNDNSNSTTVPDGSVNTPQMSILEVYDLKTGRLSLKPPPPIRTVKRALFPSVNEVLLFPDPLYNMAGTTLEGGELFRYQIATQTWTPEEIKILAQSSPPPKNAWCKQYIAAQPEGPPVLRNLCIPAKKKDSDCFLEHPDYFFFHDFKSGSFRFLSLETGKSIDGAPLPISPSSCFQYPPVVTADWVIFPLIDLTPAGQNTLKREAIFSKIVHLVYQFKANTWKVLPLLGNPDANSQVVLLQQTYFVTVTIADLNEEPIQLEAFDLSNL